MVRFSALTAPYEKESAGHRSLLWSNVNIISALCKIVSNMLHRIHFVYEICPKTPNLESTSFQILMRFLKVTLTLSYTEKSNAFPYHNVMISLPSNRKPHTIHVVYISVLPRLKYYGESPSQSRHPFTKKAPSYCYRFSIRNPRRSSYCLRFIIMIPILVTRRLLANKCPRTRDVFYYTWRDPKRVFVVSHFRGWRFHSLSCGIACRRN